MISALLFWSIFGLAINKVEINTASLEQLEEIIGIGPKLGQRIIEARPFSSIDDLLRVKGIGPKTLQKIKEQGLAYVEGEIQQTTQESLLPESSSPAIEVHPSTIPTATAEITENPVVEIKPLQPCPEGIVFNEILPSPEGADQENEWIEIFNQSVNSIDLSGLIIKDVEGVITSYIFPKNSIIGPKEYLVLKRGTTKITLNNTGDKLEILCQGKIIDWVAYEKAKKNQSYNRFDSGWQWSDIPSPGKANIISSPKLSNNSLRKNQGKLPQNGSWALENKDFQEKKTANIGEGAKNFTRKSYPLAIALILAIFSGIIIFMLKKSVKNGVNNR